MFKKNMLLSDDEESLSPPKKRMKLIPIILPPNPLPPIPLPPIPAKPNLTCPVTVSSTLNPEPTTACIILSDDEEDGINQTSNAVKSSNNERKNSIPMPPLTQKQGTAKLDPTLLNFLPKSGALDLFNEEYEADDYEEETEETRISPKGNNIVKQNSIAILPVSPKSNVIKIALLPNHVPPFLSLPKDNNGNDEEIEESSFNPEIYNEKQKNSVVILPIIPNQNVSKQATTSIPEPVTPCLVLSDDDYYFDEDEVTEESRITPVNEEAKSLSDLDATKHTQLSPLTPNYILPDDDYYDVEEETEEFEFCPDTSIKEPNPIPLSAILPKPNVTMQDTVSISNPGSEISCLISSDDECYDDQVETEKNNSISDSLIQNVDKQSTHVVLKPKCAASCLISSDEEETEESRICSETNCNKPNNSRLFRIICHKLTTVSPSKPEPSTPCLILSDDDCDNDNKKTEEIGICSKTNNIKKPNSMQLKLTATKPVNVSASKRESVTTCLILSDEEESRDAKIYQKKIKINKLNSKPSPMILSKRINRTIAATLKPQHQTPCVILSDDDDEKEPKRILVCPKINHLRKLLLPRILPKASGANQSITSLKPKHTTSCLIVSDDEDEIKDATVSTEINNFEKVNSILPKPNTIKNDIRASLLTSKSECASPCLVLSDDNQEHKTLICPKMNSIDDAIPPKSDPVEQETACPIERKDSMSCIISSDEEQETKSLCISSDSSIKEATTSISNPLKRKRITSCSTSSDDEKTGPIPTYNSQYLTKATTSKRNHLTSCSTSSDDEKATKPNYKSSKPNNIKLQHSTATASKSSLKHKRITPRPFLSDDEAQANNIETTDETMDADVRAIENCTPDQDLVSMYTLLKDFLHKCERNIVLHEHRQLFDKKLQFINDAFDKYLLLTDDFSSLQDHLIGSLAKVVSTPKLALVYYADFYRTLSEKLHAVVAVNQGTGDKAKLIKKLERTLVKLKKRIDQLDKAECDFDDDDNSSYVQVSRYKLRAVEVHEKLCKYRNLNRFTGRITHQRLNFQGSDYSEINKAINSKYKNHTVFPTFPDMVKIVKKCVKDNNLGLGDIAINTEARHCFENLGKFIQSRRKLELYQLHSEYLVNSLDDPAKDDPYLQGQLIKSYKIKVEQETKLFAKYTALQEKGALANNISEESDQPDNDSDNGNTTSSDSSDNE